MQASLKGVNRIIRVMVSDGSFNYVFKNIEAVAASEKTLTCRFQINKPQTNTIRTLHGGYIAAVTDFISAVDLARFGYYQQVSIHLGIEFLRPGDFGSWIEVNSCIVKKGNRLVFCDVLFKDEKSGELIARGSHTFYIHKDE
ncbi:unnamed protein product [Calicophoron daubneyi]|uniref:Thioesterase domain-containing protein n=1 Tax=Calicophoron daubneyi TaxID=300641 RepID=A0AAV2TB92_CALDB